MLYLFMERGSDPRYLTIKPMFEQGKIQSLRDIFIFVPKSVLIKDMGKNGDRFNSFLNHLETFPLKDLFLIGHYCNLSRTDMLKLMIGEIAAQQSDQDNKKTASPSLP
jgi:hypothetical protein